MILTSREIELRALEARTGWAIKPEGACRGDVCVPLPADAVSHGRVSARALSDRLGMPIVRDATTGIECLGPAALGRALTSTQAAELVLPDLANDRREFRLSSLRGQKVLLLAWASW
jgi:hypothetical protein